MVIVTVHGIGFEKAPEDKKDVAGYADTLHQNLKAALGPLLGDDPKRPINAKRPIQGPVYVESQVDGSAEKGLKRLKGPLLGEGPDERIAHVALVYSPLEPRTPEVRPVLQALLRTSLSFTNYASIPGWIKLIAKDVRAIRSAPPSEGSSTLRPRTDLETGFLRGKQDEAQPGPIDILRWLAVDIATYVELNNVRERVRGFVEAALGELLNREDIEKIVVNAHSQGTVVCWDVLSRLPFFVWQEKENRRARMLCDLVTAGSPIRKYVDIFTWGQLVGQLAALLREPAPVSKWINFWDPHDPVADPLNPPKAWRPCQPTSSAAGADRGLLIARDPVSGKQWHVTVDDRSVDNVNNSLGGGLRAHDYWSNQSEFIEPLAAILRDCLGESGRNTRTNG